MRKVTETLFCVFYCMKEKHMFFCLNIWISQFIDMHFWQFWKEISHSSILYVSLLLPFCFELNNKILIFFQKENLNMCLSLHKQISLFCNLIMETKPSLLFHHYVKCKNSHFSSLPLSHKLSSKVGLDVVWVYIEP